MTERRIQAGARGRGAPPLRLLGVLALSASVGIAGCENLLDVENPNNVLQEDVEQPTAATAVVNGAAARNAQAYATVVRTMSTVSDEFDFTGSQDAARENNHGNLRDPNNSYVNSSFNDASVARWMADEALRLVRGFEEEGVLPNRADLMDAELYAGLIRLLIADHFEDFVFSDRTEAAPPIGESNMGQLYDQAIEHFGTVRSMARELGDRDAEIAAVALTARGHWAKALWEKLQPRGNAPDDPLVHSPEAEAAAREFFSMSPPSDWRLTHEYSGDTFANSFSSWVTERIEIAPSTRFATRTEGDRLDEITYEDPIDGIVDPALSRLLGEVVDGGQYAPLPIVTAREMHLILAESGLATGDEAQFREHINAVRSLEPGLSSYEAQIPELDMLIHSRTVNLFAMGRRVLDLYRFGMQSHAWLHNSDAATRPGSVFVIGEEERQTNCHLLGTC